LAADPTDGELAAYVARRLGDYPADSDFVTEVIADNRDLWAMLYRIDHDLESLRLDELHDSDPSE
jgi:hypothetical protein